MSEQPESLRGGAGEGPSGLGGAESLASESSHAPLHGWSGLGGGESLASKSPHSALRGWILLFAGVSALAGFAAGLLVALQFGPDPEPKGAFARYREAIVQEFDLSPERERVLAYFLDEYERQLEDLQARGLRPLGDDQAAHGRQIHELIRDRVIPPDQRGRFQELSSLEATPF